MKNRFHRIRILTISLYVGLGAASVCADRWIDDQTSAISPERIALAVQANPLRNVYGEDFRDTAGPIIDLEPMVVSPLVTTLDRLVEDLRRDPDLFLTDKGWRENMGYRSELDEYLNLFSIPFFGLPQEFIAMQYAQDAKLEKRLEVLDRIMATRSKFRPGSADFYLQERYDLMRIKRNALFGSTWAIPELGK